jgi:hypothetical protein
MAKQSGKPLIYTVQHDSRKSIGANQRRCRATQANHTVDRVATLGYSSSESEDLLLRLKVFGQRGIRHCIVGVLTQAAD